MVRMMGLAAERYVFKILEVVAPEGVTGSRRLELADILKAQKGLDLAVPMDPLLERE